nr:immunoglobulin heavy chain junction region [Macaca mulatta]MOV41243.1 immunoglobulin heavy chain junction region [Macaca mulatta]MOV42369.1 immunoglobulin heavy chain junction region [Macaca mulatta]MOV44483.1 immunoglobulin heavy chain junction region [Macaca mulatta]MOV44516.1 immunoglobulin heavy chain junction region [Macaca mulatta]
CARHSEVHCTETGCSYWYFDLW